MNSTFAQWLARDPDPASRDELQALIDADDQAELTRRFASRLEFGTAGLRGVVGAGPGMMNRLVIRETSAGLGSYLLREVPNAATRGIIVAYDGRLDSRQFARDAACVFAALGITVYLTPDVAASPKKFMLSSHDLLLQQRLLRLKVDKLQRIYTNPLKVR